MRRLIAAEFGKLRTTRWVYMLGAGAAALAVVTVVDPNSDAATFAKPFDEQAFVLFTALLTRVLILVMGIRIVTDELRHGTIVPTLLVTPDRTRLLAAKAVTSALGGAAIAGVAWASMTGAASVVASSKGVALSLGAEAWASLAGTIVAGAAWGVIGLAVGAVVRSQVAATVGGLVWLMALEDGVRGWLGDAGGFLPGQAGLALSIGLNDAAVTAAVTLAAYVAVALGASALALRRDVA